MKRSLADDRANDRDLLPRFDLLRDRQATTGGEKPSRARRPYPADTIFLKTIEVTVEIIFFSIVQWARFSAWLVGDP